jgi:hypothetical protein
MFDTEFDAHHTTVLQASRQRRHVVGAIDVPLSFDGDQCTEPMYVKDFDRSVIDDEQVIGAVVIQRLQINGGRSRQSFRPQITVGIDFNFDAAIKRVEYIRLSRRSIDVIEPCEADPEH